MFEYCSLLSLLSINKKLPNKNGPTKNEITRANDSNSDWEKGIC